MFQSRRGFSDRLDVPRPGPPPLLVHGFNPVVGFLTVSTAAIRPRLDVLDAFQSRRGFSDRLDRGDSPAFGCPRRVSIPSWVF